MVPIRYLVLFWDDLRPFFLIWIKESSSSELGSFILSAPESLSSIIYLEEATLFSNSNTEPWNSSLSSMVELKERLEKIGVFKLSFSNNEDSGCETCFLDAFGVDFALDVVLGFGSGSYSAALMWTTIFVGCSLAYFAGGVTFSSTL